MKVVVSNEYHFVRGPDGVYTDSVYPYPFWGSLLEVFDEVAIVARVAERALPATARRVDGPGVTVTAIRDFAGSLGLVRNAATLARACWSATRGDDAFILRSPGVIAAGLREALRVRRKPFGIAVVGDPLESLAAGDAGLRAMRLASARYLREQAYSASASRYVTNHVLQERYPPRPGTVSVAASDVAIPDHLFDLPLPETRATATLRIAFVGMLERSYKGLDTLIDALGPNELVVVGDGQLRAGYEQRARGARVQFLGRLPPGAPIFDVLRGADVFVLPSRTEGMPRVLVEAMAIGLPALATPVGGVPEILPASEQFAVDDVAGLAAALAALAADPARRARLARENRERVRGYRASETRARVHEFHAAVAASARAAR